MKVRRRPIAFAFWQLRTMLLVCSLNKRGRYFADFVHGWIHTIDPSQGERADTFATGLRRPVDLRFAADGSLYVLLRNAWVKDGKFDGETGSLLKISN